MSKECPKKRATKGKGKKHHNNYASSSRNNDDDYREQFFVGMQHTMNSMTADVHASEVYGMWILVPLTI